MKKYQRRVINIAILTLIIVFSTLTVQSIVLQPPNIIDSSVTPRTVSYKGSENPGYLTAHIKTDKPVRGHIDVIGSLESTKIELSSVEYNSEYRVFWTPRNDKTDQPLAPGNYTLKLNLTDEEYNQAVGISLGNINVVAEADRKPLLEILDVTPVNIEIGPDKNPQVAVKYKLNRPANLHAEMYHGSSSVNRKDIEHSMPGNYEFRWDLKDKDGVFVRNGYSKIAFRGKELSLNPSERIIKNEAEAKINVIKANASDERLLEILPEVKFDKNIFTPDNDNADDTVTGSITLGENATMDVWISNGAGVHINHVMPTANLTPGTYTFPWDGKDFMGSTVPNGNYYYNIYITDKNGMPNSLRMFRDIKVKVDGSFDIVAAKPLRRVGVVEETIDVSVSPMAQGYQGRKGEVYPIISYGPNISYYVLLAEGVIGEIEIPDVKLMDLDKIPEKWANASNNGTKFYLDYRKTYSVDGTNYYEADKILYKGTPIQVLYEFDKWYHVGLESGEQGFVYKTDFDVTDFTTHTVASGDSLWKISNKYGVTIDAIANYNSLNKDEYLIIGQRIIIPTKHSKPPASENEEDTVIHIVQVGDSLWKIAEKYNTSIDKIAIENSIDPNQYLIIGQKINIPIEKQVPENITHIVQSGDSLWKIAQKYNTSIEAIVNANGISEIHYLIVGQKIIIPGEDTNTAEEYTTYTVQAGDTLWEIAEKFGTTIQDITELNQIEENDYILEGQELKINK